MKSLLFILNDAPFGSEHSYNGLRLANAIARREGYAIRVFLMGDAVAIRGTCMDARGLTEGDLTEGCHRGTLDQLAEWTSDNDQVLVF
jgi:uncharacterized protein involved in oxidation of intracellular sulfur